jgi:hypothetical protein
MIEIGLLIGLLISPLVAWLLGAFNPIGYLGVPPWRVPRCNCGKGDVSSFRHDDTCPRH